jgi:hypothetical protein
MPYASNAQRKYFHANAAKLEKQGVDISEWDRASAGKSLPERKTKKKVNHALREADFRKHARKK